MAMPTCITIFYLCAIRPQDRNNSTWMKGIFVLTTLQHQLWTHKPTKPICIIELFYWRCSVPKTRTICKPQFKRHSCWAAFTSYSIIELFYWLPRWWYICKMDSLLKARMCHFPWNWWYAVTMNKQLMAALLPTVLLSFSIDSLARWWYICKMDLYYWAFLLIP
jgi:hypothetical protein